MARKFYNKKRLDVGTFKVYDKPKSLIAYAKSQDTNYGFRHVVEIYIEDEMRLVGYAKATYQNRTWETYTYETAINKAIEDCKYIKAKKRIKNKIKNKELGIVKDNFRTVSNIAILGDLFGTTQKESNDWKTRMLKAGLPALDVPEDWNELSEDEKETRLNKVIAELRG